MDSTIKGVTIEKLDLARNNTIQENTISTLWIGHNNDIANNVITKGEGVTVSGDNNTLSNNVITLHSYDGVAVGGNDNTIIQNYIGTDRNGTPGLGNGRTSVFVYGENHKIGSNIIASNGGSGKKSDNEYVNKDDPKTPDHEFDTLIAGNFVGTNPAARMSLGNRRMGVLASASNVRIKGNVIASNGEGGVLLAGLNNVAQDNFIGTNMDGEKMGNYGNGIEVKRNESLIKDNVIGSNDGDGLVLFDSNE